MILSYRYFPGCTAKGLAKQVDLAMYAVCSKLGIQIAEMESAACCGAGNVQENDPRLAQLLNARTFAEAEAAGSDIVVLCNTCLLYLRRSNEEICRDGGLRAALNSKLADQGPGYSGQIDVKHILWVLLTHKDELDLEGKLAFKLKGIKIAPFYGCHILRPSQTLGFEEAGNPDSIERLIRKCGAEVADHERRLKCCGFHTVLSDEAVSLSMIQATVRSAKDAGADMIVTPCPLCMTAFDLYQSRIVPKSEQLPVVHVLQMVGMSMMLSNKELGLDKHIISLPEERTRPHRSAGASADSSADLQSTGPGENRSADPRDDLSGDRAPMSGSNEQVNA